MLVFQEESSELMGWFPPILVSSLLVALAVNWNHLFATMMEGEWRSGEKPKGPGQSRSLLADYALRKAADYYHSGALPTIFAMGSADEDTEHSEGEHEHNGFDEFLRAFYPTAHTHLDSGGATGMNKNLVSEVLPWLWLASRLEPERDYPYVEASFWLRKSLKMPRQAEAFLRDGFRNNPNSIGVCLELGKVAYQDHQNIPQSRFYLERAFELYEARPEVRSENSTAYGQLLGLLAQLEEEDQRYEQAAKYLQILMNYSPNPEAIRTWSIDMQLKASH